MNRVIRHIITTIVSTTQPIRQSTDSQVLTTSPPSVALPPAAGASSPPSSLLLLAAPDPTPAKAAVRPTRVTNWEGPKPLPLMGESITRSEVVKKMAVAVASAISTSCVVLPLPPPQPPPRPPRLLRPVYMDGRLEIGVDG